MTTTQSLQEPTPWTKQQVRDHWTLTKIEFWLALPQWTAAQAADLIAGAVPDRESTEALEMLYGEFIPLPPEGEDRLVVLKVKNKREKITLAARAHHMEEASPEEWLKLAGSLGIAPDWRQLGINEGLLTDGHPESAAKVKAVERSITKQQVVNAFEGIRFKRNRWSKNLGDINSAPWLKNCRVMPGRQGSKASATWNPALIAAALFDKGTPIKQLDAVFASRLKDWSDEWHETAASFRD